MTAAPIQAILDVREEVRKVGPATLERVQKIEGTNGARFNATVPGLGRSLSEIHTRLLGMVDLANGFDGVEYVALVPSESLSAFRDCFLQLRQSIEELKSQLDNIDENGGPGSLNTEEYTVQSCNGAAQADLKTLLKQIHDRIDTCLQQYYNLAIALGGERYHDFSTAFENFTARTASLAEKVIELEKSARKASEEAQEITSLRQQATQLKEEIEHLKREIETDRKSISEYAGETGEKVAVIRETATQADTLKASVQGYQGQFDQFQTQLQAREKTFAEGKAAQDRLLGKLGEIEAEIGRLNQQAEAMLTGATVAGLASSYGQKATELTKELWWARAGFYAAICILFVSALPLAAYVIPGLSALLSGSLRVGPPPGEASPTELLGQIAVRMLLLVPGAWLARFMAARHAALFRLREHYGYKHSVASSVEGFKKQAEPFKDGIAAAAFFELTANPADRMEGRGREDRAERHPNPVMDWMMKKLGTTYDGKSG